MTKAQGNAEANPDLVEDNPDWREALSLILIDAGYFVLTAEDGLQALALIDEAQPDLIITDITMPNLDGIELIKRLRKLVQSRVVPIIVMSALDSGITDDAMNAGASQCASKPVHLDFLLNLIDQMLS